MTLTHTNDNHADRRRRALVCCVTFVLAGIINMHVALARPTVSEDDQPLAVDLTGKDEGYSTVLYDNTSGLPTSEANAIAETSEGFIWIGSYSGLIRYDGNTFERIDSTTGVASVVSLFVDSQDRLWVGTNDSGVAVMEQGEFRFYTKTDGLGSSSVRAIAEDAQGNVYIGTTNGISYVDPSMELHQMEASQVSDAYVRSLRLGADDVIYGVTMNEEVFSLEGGKLKDFYGVDELGVADVISVLPDPTQDGYVYLGTEHSTVYHGRLEGGLKDARKIDVSPLAYVKSVEVFQGQLWVCTDKGIGVLEDDGRVRKLDNIPLSNSIDHVMRDYEGNLWFTSSRQGVMKVVPNQFSDIFYRFDLPPAVVNTTCRLGSRLFIGTDDGLTVVDSKGKVDSVPLKGATTASGGDLGQTDLVDMLSGVRIRSIIPDSQDRLWISTYGNYGLVRFDGSTATCFTVDDGLPSDRVRTVCERRDGSMLVACTGGLAMLDGDQVVRSFTEVSGLANSEILTVAEASNGNIVLGSDGGGIYVLHGTNITHIGTESGLSSDVIMRIKHDERRDVFWIVTSNSLAYMDADYHVTTIRNFPYSNNFDLYENKLGEMWVLSSNGIYVVPADELLANKGIAPVYYGRDNGLPCIATANSYSALTADGSLYIAGTTGVAKVNIDKPLESVDAVKMAVPYVEADGEVCYPDGSGRITVPANVSKITVYPFVYSYSFFNPRVTYRLDGFDQTETTVRRSELDPIDYTNLAGGNYRFVMRIQDAMGHGNKELSIPITKQLSIYEHTWFRVLCLVVVALVIEEIVRFRYRKRTQELERKEQENKTFIREMIEAFAKTIDMKDAYTNGHSSRVAEYTTMLTRELGYDEETVERYYNIALLHDIGKIGIPAEVLNKPGKLTDEEYETIKSHTTLGYNVLKDISIMPELAVGAWAHHERPDGRGYPRGLTLEEMPRVAQIIAVADTFDAMYSNRPYRKRMNFEKAVSIIKEVKGTQLTSDVVDAFLRLVERGEFRAPDDTGGGTTEDIDNIHKQQGNAAGA